MSERAQLTDTNISPDAGPSAEATIDQGVGKHAWVRASAAYAEILRGGEHPVAAGQRLAYYLQLGLLSARSRTIFESRNTLSRAWNERPDPADSFEEISPAYWRESVDWIADQSEWRWSAGNLHVTLSNGPAGRKRRLMHHVEFRLKDLKEVLPAVFAPSKRRRGPAPDLDKRDAGWSAVLHLALMQSLNKTNYSTALELGEKIFEMTNVPGADPTVGQEQANVIARKAFKLLTA